MGNAVVLQAEQFMQEDKECSCEKMSPTPGWDALFLTAQHSVACTDPLLLNCDCSMAHDWTVRWVQAGFGMS